MGLEEGAYLAPRDELASSTIRREQPCDSDLRIVHDWKPTEFCLMQRVSVNWDTDDPAKMAVGPAVEVCSKCGVLRVEQ